MSAEIVADKHRFDDPLSLAMLPPKDESPEDRTKRLATQHEAARISREIDDSLQESKRLFDMRKKAIKVLLLGELVSRYVFVLPSDLREKAKQNRERAQH